MRGDRPASSGKPSKRAAAAPHARGSTPRRALAHTACSGCPACAGIDPLARSIPRGSHGLPRMRGDRPSARWRSTNARWAAPHARGSTHLCGRGLLTSDGCPACAGIDPRKARGRQWLCWLPRMRGDRPQRKYHRSLSLEAAPHARGSTPAADRATASAAGCPACAGIDPARTPLRPCRRRLPRMRGDRPTVTSLGTLSIEAAPHARGSTRLAATVDAREGGCPACAGIDPSQRSSRRLPSWLPRMRGDRPTGRALRQGYEEAAPHARGSTPHRLDRERGRGGCPACAGIDPPRRPASTSPSRLPRMRGDRPAQSATFQHALGAAPHARGSTLIVLAGRPGLGGCPACAGIDP